MLTRIFTKSNKIARFQADRIAHRAKAMLLFVRTKRETQKNSPIFSFSLKLCIKLQVLIFLRKVDYEANAKPTKSPKRL